MKAESFKQRVMSCFRAWEDWALYPMDSLIKLQNIFLGLVATIIPEPEPEPKEKEPIKEASVEQDDSDEDVDGVPLDGAALLKASAGLSVTRPDSRTDEESLDGAPIEISKPNSSRAGFVSSKWETVDPEEVKAQAVTTSKWEVEEKDQLVKARKALMGSVASKWDDKDEDIDGEPLDQDTDDGEIPDVDTRVTEERRALLRDVEVKVMQYQDELENGRKGIKSGWTISDQVEHYRKKMLRKATEKQLERDSPRDKSPGEASDTPERKPERSSRKKKRRRTRSSSGSRSRSRERNRSRDGRNKRRKSRSPSSSPDRIPKRSQREKERSRSRSPKRSKRSRSRSQRKQKKKRH